MGDIFFFSFPAVSLGLELNFPDGVIRLPNIKRIILQSRINEKKYVRILKTSVIFKYFTKLMGQ